MSPLKRFAVRMLWGIDGREEKKISEVTIDITGAAGAAAGAAAVTNLVGATCTVVQKIIIWPLV